MFRAHALQHRHAVNIGHYKVEYDNRDVFSGRPVQVIECFLTTVNTDGLEAKTADNCFQNAALSWIVIDDQNGLDHDAILCPWLPPAG